MEAIYKTLGIMGMLYVLISISYSLICRFKRKKSSKDSDTYLSRVRRKSQRKSVLYRIFYFDANRNRRRLLLYLPAVSLIPWIDNLQHFEYARWAGVFSGIIIVYGIGRILSYYPIDDTIPRVLQYVMNLSNLLIYVLVFISKFQEFMHNFRLLFITVFIVVFFSFMFIRSILLHFKNFGFLFINIVLYLVLNLGCFGLAFGFVYFGNNDVFKYFPDDEYKLLDSNFDDKYLYYLILFIIHKGLKPFYNYQDLTINTDFFDGHGYMIMVPFFEYILAVVFSVCILSFIISSLVTRTVKGL